jgi:hypothetical protein
MGHCVLADTDQALGLIDRAITPTFLFTLRANNRADRIDQSCPLTLKSFSRTPQTSKSFKFLNFSAPQSHIQIARVVEIERHLFSREVNYHTVACCAYKAKRR